MSPPEQLCFSNVMPLQAPLSDAGLGRSQKRSIAGRIASMCVGREMGSLGSRGVP